MYLGALYVQYIIKEGSDVFMHPDKRAAIKWAIVILVIMSIIAYSLYRKEWKGAESFNTYVHTLVVKGLLDEEPIPIEDTYLETEYAVFYNYSLGDDRLLLVTYDVVDKKFGYEVTYMPDEEYEDE